MNKFQKAATLVGTTGLVTLGTAQAALATTTPTDAGGVYSDAGASLRDDLLVVSAGAVTAGIVILGVKKGWPMLKRFF